MKKLFEINDLEYKFTDKVLYNGLQFDILEKDLVCIYGESGSGKTTLLNILGLLENQYEGEVKYKGINTNKLTSKQRTKILQNEISFIFQNYGLIESETILYNLELAIRNNKEIKKSDLKNLIEKYMIKLELNLDINRKFYTLSGGEHQRIALIRLFLKPCKLILADEPTGSLDDKSSEIVINFLRELSKEKSVVIVTHDSNLINSIEKRIKIG